jgi:Ca2+-binding EF-hand superfamily protein
MKSQAPTSSSAPPARLRRDTGRIAAFWLAAIAVSHGAPPRPDLAKAPLATAKLQTMAQNAAPPAQMANAVLYATQPAAENPMANYQRTALGDWPAMANVDREDPWVRFLLLAPARPVIVDVAAFIDGKPFREAREAWIDDVLKEGEALDSPAPSIVPAAATEAAAEPPAAESTVEVERRVRPTIRSRVLNYIAASVEPVAREEVRWLIAEWGSGPAVVVLGPSLSWQRASEAPLLAYLDGNRDGALSAAEIAGAEEALDRADRDGDQVVDEAELRRAAARPAVWTAATGHPLLAALDDNTEWQALAAELDRIYGHMQGAKAGRWLTSLEGESAAKSLAEAPADVTLRVDLAADGKQASGISLVKVGPSLQAANPAAGHAGDVVVLDIEATPLECSAAAQGADDVAATQVAIGAVIDGNPLMRLLDGDQDRRLTLRERQQLGGLLATLDRDGDGAISAAEIPIPLRFGVTLGPNVHALFAAAAGAARAITPRDVQAAPDWFASMDKNSDRDLSRDEFLGTAEQFAQIDADADGLVSVEEALQAKIE